MSIYRAYINRLPCIHQGGRDMFRFWTPNSNSVSCARLSLVPASLPLPLLILRPLQIKCANMDKAKAR